MACTCKETLPQLFKAEIEMDHPTCKNLGVFLIDNMQDVENVKLRATFQETKNGRKQQITKVDLVDFKYCPHCGTEY